MNLGCGRCSSPSTVKMSNPFNVSLDSLPCEWPVLLARSKLTPPHADYDDVGESQFIPLLPPQQSAPANPSTSTDLRPQINSLIAVELRSLLPKTATPVPTNLSHITPPRPLPSSPFLASELARLESKKPTAPGVGLDTMRYGIPKPVGAEAQTVDGWEKAHDSSLAQLEHQRLRAMNGQLLNSLGANAWKIQNFSMENTVERVEKEGEELRKVVEEVNRERKRSQEAAGEVLNRLEKKWTELVSGNMQLEIGCLAV